MNVRLAPSGIFALFDIWRILCASFVVLSHAGQLNLLPSVGTSLMAASHHAVIIFFVISGFSVAYSSAKQGNQVEAFLSARFSRILSVAVPAVFMTLGIDFIGQLIATSGVESWQLKRWWFYLGFNTVFAGELWFWSIHPFSNVPFWSLDYEVYYYLIFSATLIKNATWRPISILAIALIVGPKVLLLLPCWWLGVGLFGWLQGIQSRNQHPVSASFTKFALPSIVFLALYLAFIASGAPSATQQWVAPWQSYLQYSKNFIGDTVVALLFTGCAAWHAHLNANNNFTLSEHISNIAPHTFALYALHYPFLNLLAATAIVKQPEPLNLAITTLVATGCLAIGAALSPSRNLWRKAITQLLDVVNLRR
jgi:peptidoglycan/LPS O-acetylase OafA/YrhL